MEIALRIVSVLIGIGLIVTALVSASKTILIPRPSVSLITRWVFLATRALYRVIAPPALEYRRRDAILASYAPVSMVATLSAWLALTFLGFAAIYWGLEGDVGATEAIELS